MEDSTGTPTRAVLTFFWSSTMTMEPNSGPNSLELLHLTMEREYRLTLQTTSMSLDTFLEDLTGTHSLVVILTFF